MGTVIVQLFGIFFPIYQRIVAEHKATTGAEPTDEEVIAVFHANIALYLAEGAQWTATHPKADQ